MTTRLLEPFPVETEGGRAVELFVESLALLQAPSRSRNELDAAREITRLVDGNPLAIDLAASRALELGVTTVL
ncbi:hypothetical protein [Rhizobium anhuiense]|uniref:hypothetical protein n=1 Tax=Rhizobium anhuiense TaxID=1184720 RepID=UPI00117A4D47|nr:hypothetical protein [Rhizobium anhuiense]